MAINTNRPDPDEDIDTLDEEDTPGVPGAASQIDAATDNSLPTYDPSAQFAGPTAPPVGPSPGGGPRMDGTGFMGGTTDTNGDGYVTATDGLDNGSSGDWEQAPIDDAMQQWILDAIRNSGGNTTEDEALIHQMTAESLERDRRNARAASGRAGMIASGALGAQEGDLARNANQAAMKEILDLRDREGQQAFENAAAAAGIDIGMLDSITRSRDADARAEAMESLGGGGGEQDIDTNGDGIESDEEKQAEEDRQEQVGETTSGGIPLGMTDQQMRDFVNSGFFQPSDLSYSDADTATGSASEPWVLTADVRNQMREAGFELEAVDHTWANDTIYRDQFGNHYLLRS